MLHRLTLGVQPAAPEDGGSTAPAAEAAQPVLAGAALGAPLAQSVQRSSARLLAILAENEEALVRRSGARDGARAFSL